jgi:uncharacterized protein YegL
MSALPGGPFSSRPLHIIWILDTSGSMTGVKIQSLNYAIREAIPSLRDTAQGNPDVEVLIRAVTFSSGARWHIATPTPVADFYWEDVSAEGVTDMGAALSLVAAQMSIPPMTGHALPPVLILVSDGWPTDDFDSGLQRLLAEPWGRTSIRLAISIGRDADRDALASFIGSAELTPLEANNSATLVDYVRWASTAVVESASADASQPLSPLAGTSGTPVPSPPSQSDPDSVVW